MKNTIKRFLVLMMVVMTIGGTATTASASSIATYASSYLESYSSGIEAHGTTIYVDFTVAATRTQEQVGVFSITAHQLQSDGTWDAVGTTYNSPTNNFVAYDTNFHAGTHVYRGVSGHTYRFAIRAFAGGEAGSDARTYYSQPITI